MLKKLRIMNSNNVITIRNLIDYGLNEYLNYKDMLVISYVEDLSLFKFPCHLKATTILVCLNGEMDGAINLKNYKIRKHSILINFPENIIHINNVKDIKAIAILISSEFVHSLSLEILSHTHYYSYEINKNGSFSLPQKEIRNLSHYLSIIKNAITSSITSANEEMIKHLVAAFLTNIMLLHHHYHCNLINDVKATKGSYMILDRFMELIGLYHSKEREVKFYADKMCITPKHLSNVVRKVSGKTATDWISEFVILEAKSLLIYSGSNIQEVSLRLNFPTQSAFGKYFKCQVGMSPSEFIETNRTFKPEK